MIYKTIDLCAGIGGIRRGFELVNLKMYSQLKLMSMLAKLMSICLEKTPKTI